MPGFRTLLALSLGIAAAPVQAQTPLASPSPEAGGRYGEAVSSLGDADGDGIRDVLIGAPGESVGGDPGAGRVYIVSGATLGVIRTFESPTPEASGAFGFAVGSAGDLNGDGFTDAIIGAPGETAMGLSRGGRAYVLSGADGSVLLDPVPPRVWENGEYGYSVARMGDTNGDGTNDYIIGAPGSRGSVVTPTAPDAGAHFIVSGSTGEFLLQSFSLRQDGGRDGAQVRGGDFDGDGLSGTLVSRPLQENGQVSQRFNQTNAGVLSAPEPFSGFGRTLDVIGGRDGTGRADFVVGASEGALIYDGTDQNLLLTITSPDGPGDDFGFSVAGAGNVDETGVADLIVGAPLASPGGVSASGRVFIHSGDDGALLFSLTSPNRVLNGRFGHAVALVGDVDDDNTADQLIGAPGETVGGATGAGRAYLLLSSTVVTSEPLAPETWEITASPNPVTGVLRVRVSGASPEATAVVFDALGREVARGSVRRSLVSFDASEWAPGVYSVRVADGGRASTATITVAR